MQTRTMRPIRLSVDEMHVYSLFFVCILIDYPFLNPSRVPCSLFFDKSRLAEEKGVL